MVRANLEAARAFLRRGVSKKNDSSAAKSMEAVRKSIAEGATLNLPYLVMNGLAAIVASYGLLQNSAAVVIGAMIIAMLLGPITGIALALVDGNNGLLKRSLLAELAGVVVVLVVTYVIGTVHRGLPLSQQILDRTRPNILDLMIALAGGAAGAYATVSARLSVGLVGVAIATALVPPLATCGICLARGDFQLAFGGFLLFFANLVAIQFASSVVMWLEGFNKLLAKVEDKRTYFTRIGASGVLLLVLAIVLGLNFYRTISRQDSETLARNTLKKALEAYPGVYLAEVRFVPAEKKTLVYAVVRAPYSIAPPQVATIQALLKPTNGETPELHVRSVITKEATAEGYQHELKESNTEDQLNPSAQELTR